MSICHNTNISRSRLTSRLEWREERCVNFSSTVNSQPIDTIIGHEAGDPTLPLIKNIRVLGPQIREGNSVISLPADLDAIVIIVVNEAEWVVI